MDLKIEVRKLYALHEATVRLDHAIREDSEADWTAFAPSRFIYAFFTFNAIYSFDWKSSFHARKAVPWSPDGTGRFPSEEEQFKSYLTCMNERLAPETSQLFARQLKQSLLSHGIVKPAETLRDITVVNAGKKLKELARQMPGQFENLRKGVSEGPLFFAAAVPVFKFVYQVRCNLFHGQKTRVQLLDASQQQRLLIYAALLIAANGLLFQAARRGGFGWHDVYVDFDGEQADCGTSGG
jgi:hypothetical protein